ncbi:peptide ABC transporter substrate-binding protein [Streptococcus panodentis]|uniref:Peptide ABC transporter ATP-binding protein n=1 Tax=Streptococcus panodentis TaxID=1581472 RepID=A0ABS5AYM3_9STRE|nr:peptide ABC transporter substrate-binding protein [Streptococcus panodentis]MBP2621348.1 peptide ABC transporter ATP-binding protein [Streptococcus panodentis]
MKASKLAAATGLMVLSAGILAACSFGGSNSSGKNYSYVYTADPDTLDYTVSNKQATNEIMANVVDGLLENDQYGNLVPSLAEDWTVSKDGLTYTYQLRKGVKWYTSDGEEYADVTAQDFVTSLKHAADSQSDGLYIVQKSIKGLDDYVNGKIKDFSQVGVKAVDDSTVQYTLNQPESYWNSKTTMGILFPVNEEFLESKGNQFAQGTDPTSVLYNGPFILKSITSKSQISLEKNPNYWDKEKVNVDNVKFSYYDGQDTESLVRGFSDGNYTIARVFPNGSNFASVKKQYGENIVYTPQGSGTFVVTTNIDRQSYEHTSKTTEAQKSSAKKALLNKDFRQALLFAFNRTAYSAQINGEEAADKQLRNTFVPPTFVQANGQEFGSIVEENLAGYGDEWKGVTLDDAQDGLYNPDKAKAELAKAKEALQAEGAEFPIHLDIPVSSADTNGVKGVQSLKQSIEANLGSDNVVIDIQQITDDELNNITYFATSASQQDWDLNNNLGWSPDYNDPSSYLEITNSKTGESADSYFGFDSGTDNAAAKQAGFEEYDRLLEDAAAENEDINKRYEKYAAAQAWLTDSALLIPAWSSGATPSVRKVVPFSGPFAWTGSKGEYSFKYVKIQDKAVTAKEFEQARKKWLKEKEKSNKKAQEEAEEHVK